MNGFGAVISRLLSSLCMLAFSLLQIRERNEAKESLPTALHAHSIERNTQKPGFCMKVRTAGGVGRLNAFASLEKSILGKILAFLPIAGQAIDSMENQLIVFMNERLYRLVCRHSIHTTLFSFVPGVSCLARLC